MLERTVRELQGIQCVDLEHMPQPKQEIACTRSFGHPVTQLHDLAEAVTEFASRAAQKLRKQHSLTGQVLCFVRTSPFRSDPQYSRSITVPMRRPSADTALIVAAALTGLRAIYRPGFKMAKAGVMLLELQPDSMQQHELALDDDDVEGRGRLMETLDVLNLRYGRGTVSLASAGLAGDRRAWSMKQERRTPQYTTNWTDIAVARA
jgi:DNA polymerase V